MFLGPVTEVEVSWQKKADLLERCIGYHWGNEGWARKSYEKLKFMEKAYRGFNRAGDENTETPPPIITVRP